MIDSGVKESDYVSLGNCGKSTRSIYALACGDTIKEVGFKVRKHGEAKRAAKNGENGKDITTHVQNKEKSLQVIIEADEH